MSENETPAWRRLAKRAVGDSVGERLAISVAALALAIVTGAVIILFAGWAATTDWAKLSCAEPWLTVGGTSFCYNPVSVYSELFLGALGHPFTGGWQLFNYNLASTLQQASVLVFTGLAVAVAFRAGLFNIGVQGQLIAGALASALFAHWLVPIVPASTVGTIIILPVALVAGAAFGGLFGAVPGWLKAYAGANEVITTIMLNFVAGDLAFYLTETFFQAPNSQLIETTPLPPYARLLPVLFGQGSKFAIGVVVLGVAFAVGVTYLFARTSFGYDIRASGEQPEAASYGGVNAERLTVASMSLSGAIAGVGGAVWVLMMTGRYITDVPGFGFDGITVSILAGNNPLGALLAAFLFGMLKAGSLSVQFNLGIPKELVGVLRGLIILFVAMPTFFRLYGGQIAGAWRSVRDRGRSTKGGEASE